MAAWAAVGEEVFGARWLRPDDRALELLRAHPLFAQDAFAWMGAEHLGGGLFCASVYTGTAADSPYLWITESEEDPDKFLACVTPAERTGCDSGQGDLPAVARAAELLRFYDHHRQRYAEKVLIPEAGWRVASGDRRRTPRRSRAGQQPRRVRSAAAGDWADRPLRQPAAGDGTMSDYAKGDRVRFLGFDEPDPYSHLRVGYRGNGLDR